MTPTQAELDERFYDLGRFFWHAKNERVNAETVEEINYWQGQKDAFRKSMIIYAPNEERRESWRLQQESSPAGYASEMEKLQALVKDANRILEMVEEDNVPLLSLEAEEWLEQLKKSGVWKDE